METIYELLPSEDIKAILKMSFIEDEWHYSEEDRKKTELLQKILNIRNICEYIAEIIDAEIGSYHITLTVENEKFIIKHLDKADNEYTFISEETAMKAIDILNSYEMHYRMGRFIFKDEKGDVYTHPDYVTSVLKEYPFLSYEVKNYE